MAVDEELCDIVHFIELYEHDEKKSLDLIECIQDCRKRRRVIKDKYYIAETFAAIFKIEGIEDVLMDVNRQIKNMKNREYLPRQLKELFVGAVKQTKKLDEKNMEESMQENFFNNEYVEQTMNYERHDTVFDGVETDWNAMAMQQKEFFENIGQYIINIQLDLEELDMEIEKLMQQYEDAKCNVTQGYKMFKQLKELRLTRKKKITELNKVIVIADCFDCASMADTYRYCVDTLEEQALVQNESQKSEQAVYQSDAETKLLTVKDSNEINEAV